MTHTTKVQVSGAAGHGKRKILTADHHSAKKIVKKRAISKGARRKIRNVALALLGVTILTSVLGGLWFFSYLQQLNEELPSLEAPFRDKELASVIYDRSGKIELARLIGDADRDPVDIKDIPEHVKWAFLATEDIDFYTHQGFDPAGIVRCGVRFVTSGGSSTCGGSTITQQVIKITVLGPEVKIERKLKEMLMAIKIEQAYSKDQILQLYLTVAPFGGNIYGITTAAEFYFGKEVKDLTLAEAAILASIVQNPVQLSPTRGFPDPKTAQAAVKWRQENVVLELMRRNIDKINSQTRTNYNDQELDDVVTREAIEAAIKEPLTYQPPIFTERKAGHFVDYVQQVLTERNYKFGEAPFTDTELLTGGYQIYTTLDWKIQNFAEQTVADAARSTAKAYGGDNAALLLTTPKNGEIIAMVGSKNYNGRSSGCNKQGHECSFDPQVNILTTRHSPGSSTKPFGYYEAYRQGLMHTGSLLPDIPIQIGSFDIKNWNSTFFGVSPKTFAGQMLADSRNLPAVIVQEAIGTERFVEMMRSFGYTTFGDPDGYGHSLILGGSDVIPVEHAQGYGVFANGGKFVQHEVVTKIVDRNGTVVYEAKPERKQVADEKATFLLNQSILNNNSVSWDGRDVSMKSGTSQDNKDNWIVMYSPDFVVIGWVGNNNNKPMSLNAFGETTVTTWLKNFMRQVGDTTHFRAKTPFKKPDGVSRSGGCALTNKTCFGSYSGIAGGWKIDKFDYAADNVRVPIRVCKSQRTRLARPIDEYFDNAVDSVAITYTMPYVPQWQRYLNSFLSRRAVPNGGPTQYCNKDYSGSGVNGVWINSTNISNNEVIPANTAVTVSGQAFTTRVNATPTVVDVYFDGVIQQNNVPVGSNGNFSTTITVPAASYENGTYQLRIDAFDSAGTDFTQTYTVVLVSTTTPDMNGSVTSAVPAVSQGASGSYSYRYQIGTNAVINTAMSYTGVGGPGALSGVQMCYRVGGSAFTCGASTSIVAPYDSSNGLSSYDIDFYYTAGFGNTGTLRSATVKIQITEI